jgi:hypothetical protein
VDGAEKAWRRSAQLFQELLDQWGDLADYHFGAGQALANLGWLQLRKRRLPGESLPLLQDAAGRLEQARRRNPENPLYRRTLGFAYDNLAEARLSLRDHAGAADAVEHLLRNLSAPDRERYNAARFLARCFALSEQDQAAVGDARREERSRRYRERSLELLRSVDPHGYRPPSLPRDDAAFAALRDQPDFEKAFAAWGDAAPRP